MQIKIVRNYVVVFVLMISDQEFPYSIFTANWQIIFFAYKKSVSYNKMNKTKVKNQYKCQSNIPSNLYENKISNIIYRTPISFYED